MPNHTPTSVDLFGNVKFFKVYLNLIYNVVERYGQLYVVMLQFVQIYILEKNLTFKSNLCERSIKKLSCLWLISIDPVIFFTY